MSFENERYVSNRVDRIEHLEQEVAKLTKELEQQKFNNKHNLSIDQQVSDKIDRLRKENEKLKDLLKFSFSFLPKTEPLKDSFPTFYHTLNYEGDLMIYNKVKEIEDLLKE